MNDRKILANFLKSKRIEAGITQRDVAAKLGYTTPQFISNWERGLSSPPIPILRKISEMYGVSEDDLFQVVLKATIRVVEHDLRNQFYGKRRAAR